MENFIDPKIRDNVFLPLVLLMLVVNYLRFQITKVLNSQSHPLLESASVSFKTLRGTMLESKADLSKQKTSNEDEVDLNASLGKVKDEIKHAAAMVRSSRIRKAGNFLPE